MNVEHRRPQSLSAGRSTMLSAYFDGGRAQSRSAISGVIAEVPTTEICRRSEECYGLLPGEELESEPEPETRRADGLPLRVSLPIRPHRTIQPAAARAAGSRSQVQRT